MNKIEDDTESSNSELIKKYRFLFTLPKSRIISVLIGIFSYVAFPLSYLIRFRPSVFEIVTVASILGITFIIWNKPHINKKIKNIELKETINIYSLYKYYLYPIASYYQLYITI